METSRFLYGCVIRVVLGLLCIVTVGCHHQQSSSVATGNTGRKTVCNGDRTDCGNKDINADPQNGVDKQEVCACGGDVITWKGNGHTFQVEFKKNGSPFPDPNETFYNGHDHGTAQDFPHQRRFDYKITVDGTAHDPRIVGGGGHPLQ